MTLTVWRRMLSISSVLETLSLYCFMRLPCRSSSEKIDVSSLRNADMAINNMIARNRNASISGFPRWPPIFLNSSTVFSKNSAATPTHIAADTSMSMLLEMTGFVLNILRLYSERINSTAKARPNRVSHGKVLPGSICTILPIAMRKQPMISSLTPGAFLPLVSSILRKSFMMEPTMNMKNTVGMPIFQSIA